MNIFKLKRLFEIDCSRPVSIERIMFKYDEYLRSMYFKTDSKSGDICFMRKNRYRGEALNIFRDGSVSIFFKNDQLNVNWTVELDILYYLSGLIGLILGLTADLLFNASFSVSIITGLIASALTLIFGTLSIVSNINDINSDCLSLETKKL